MDVEVYAKYLCSVVLPSAMDIESRKYFLEFIQVDK